MVAFTDDDYVRRIAEKLGEQVAPALLRIIARAPLDAELQGVSIYSNGVWLESTLAGAEGQPLSNHIFGEIEVASLDDDNQPISAFDMSRSMQLNRGNPIVQSLIAFIGREVDCLRRELVRADQARRQETELRRLQEQGDKIAELINEDFGAFRQRIPRTGAHGGKGRDQSEAVASDNGDTLLSEAPEGLPGNPVAQENTGGEKSQGENRSEQPAAATALEETEAGERRGLPIAGIKKRKANRGGFQVRFDNLGELEHRAKYVREERVIYVNMDHPQISAAKGDGPTTDLVFRRLAYEVAFSEYAIALAYELAENDEFLDMTEPVSEIRETINRMGRRAALLYSVT